MPAIVVGEKRIVEGNPGELPEASLQRARQALADRKTRLEEDQTTPKPAPLEGYCNPIWSKKETRWMCRPRDEDKWRIWYKEKWYTFEDYEKC